MQDSYDSVSGIVKDLWTFSFVGNHFRDDDDPMQHYNVPHREQWLGMLLFRL